MKKLFNSPYGTCVLHTWGGNGWQFNELTVFGPDGYAVREDGCGGMGTEPLDLFITRLTGLSAAEAAVIASETTAWWRDSGEEREQTEQSRMLLRQFSSTIMGTVSVGAAVAAGVFAARRRNTA